MSTTVLKANIKKSIKKQNTTKRKSKWYITKYIFNTKDRDNGEIEGKIMTYKRELAKWQKFFLLSKYIKYKWNKLRSQKLEIRRMYRKKPNMTQLQEIHFPSKDRNLLNVKGWKKIFHETMTKKNKQLY